MTYKENKRMRIIKKCSTVIQTCKRPLFDFKLTEVERVIPFGESLSWFALTDGFYRIDLGNDYLLNYSDAVTQSFRHSAEYKGRVYSKYDSYVDYYVVRLWEDILEVLPVIREPIPDELRLVMNQPFKWEAKAQKWLDDKLDNHITDTGENWDTYYAAVGWLDERFLYSMHLRARNKICFWLSEDGIMNISWDNRGIKFNKTSPYWSANNGVFSLTKDEFLRQIKLFNDTLMLEMEKRIKYVTDHWNNPKISFDPEHLMYEHRQRINDLSEMLDYPIKKTDFNAVLKAIEKMGIGLKP